MRYIQVHVHEDGDVELTAVDASPSHKFIGTDLIFAPAEISRGSLDKELADYGCDADDARRAIDAALTSQPGESFIVGKV